MKTRKILIIIDNLVRGGKERRLIELLKGLKASPFYEAELVIFSKRIEYPEVFDLELPIHFLERQSKKDPKIFKKFYSLCKEIKPDLIHSWGSMTSIYAIPTVKLQRIKFLNALIADAPHNLGLRDKRFLRTKATYPFSDVVLSNSEAGLVSYRVPEGLGICIHNGFDFNRISKLSDPQEIREQYNIWTPYIVGMVGNFGNRKDYLSYLDAAMQVVDQRDDVSFLAIGGGPDWEKMKTHVGKKYEGRIIFTGMISNVESVVNTFDIGVLASNKDYHGEGISNAIMEYMALGKPVIATDCGGTKEIVIHEKTGYLIENKDVAGLSQYICNLLDHEDLAAEMGQAGAKSVRENFNLELMVSRYFELYEKMLGISTQRPTLNSISER